MEHIIEHLIKSENVCDDNCEPSKPTGEALMDKKELFDALDMLNYNEEEIDLAVLYYRMFPSDYSIRKDGIVNDDLERQLILVEWGDGQKVYPLDADGLLKNENNPDEWKDKHSKFKKKKKEQIWDKILEIAGLNSDINDLSVDNATTYYEILDEEREVAKLKEEIWNLYSDEHMEGEHINQSDQHANGLQLDERPKPTCINEQHNHNCQQFYGFVDTEYYTTKHSQRVQNQGESVRESYAIAVCLCQGLSIQKEPKLIFKKLLTTGC